MTGIMTIIILQYLLRHKLRHSFAIKSTYNISSQGANVKILKRPGNEVELKCPFWHAF